MNKREKITSKFEIEEVEDRVEFFFLTGVINKILGTNNPYRRSDDWGDNWWGNCQPKKNYCGKILIGRD